MTINPETKAEIFHLLETTTLSAARIAKRLGVGASTVKRMAEGVRRLKREAYKRKSAYVRKAKRRRFPRTGYGPVEWCPTCEARVKTPCTACAVREWMRQKAQ